MRRQCLDKSCRRADWSAKRPTVWQPQKVINPEYKDYEISFTEISAWEFIAKLLGTGHLFKKKVLEKPPGAVAYEAWATLDDEKVLYVKIEPKSNIIFGRSFHYDMPPI